MSNVTYSSRHRQSGTPVLNIQSTLRTAPDLYRNVSPQFHFVATVIHIQSVRSQICVHITCSQCREEGHAKETKRNWDNSEYPARVIGSPALV